MALALEPVVRTHVGLVREQNEDRVFASPRLAVVADGVGGAAAGEVASSVAIDQLILMDKSRLGEPLERALARALGAANASVGFIAACRPRTAGMSTTMTAVAIDRGRYAVANVGDSRAYLLRAAELTRLTRDDSVVEELVESGALAPAEARRHPQRSVVLKVLDGDPGVSPAIAGLEARRGDRLLLCSDGLTDFVDEDAVRAALAIESAEEVANRLLELALAAGGRDNVSLVVADVVELADPAFGWQPPV